MFKCQKNKFWLENPINLLCSIDVIPLDDMNIAEKMNCLTRLVIIIFFILTFVGFKQSLLFLLLSLLFIIILYYIERNHMNREPYIQQINNENNLHSYPIPQNLGAPLTVTRTANRFCNDSVQLDGPKGAFNNPDYISVNQKLAGPQNPKTKIAPVVAPPLADLDYWRTNNLVTHSAINEETNIDLYNSGYQVATCCPKPIHRSQETKEDFTHSHKHQASHVDEPHSFPYFKNPPVAPNQSGWVNTACGYNPEQLITAGLPTNLASGNCEQDPLFKQYNENLFTQTIQPGVYTKNEIIEPINSNIGISFQQQFNPTTVQVNPENGNVLYTEHDPRLYKPEPKQPCETTQSLATPSNVYDPRFTGYGTSYRSYTEPVTGQTRFYYNDVDAIRMPNYIVRSNIDHEPYSDQYGPIQAGNEFGNKYNSDIRAMANNSFLEATIQHRTELQERLMRKNNARAWQQRQAPINRNTQRSMNNSIR